MARSRHYWQVGLAAIVLACPACMAPGAPAPAAPAAGAAAAAPAGPAPFASADPDLAPPAGIIGKMCQAIDDCRRKICKAPCGQLINGMTAPISGLTGGVIPMFCPEMPGLKDLAKPGVMGEAAAVKKDALEAKARRDAVRLLGTVDCRYYADAEGKLITALRTDGSECVRYEAAIALGRGCCCTKNVVAALDITVGGLETDGNPAERSYRVRDAAAAALENCLACAPPAPPEDVLPEPKKKGTERTETTETTMESAEPEKKVSSRAPSPAQLERARATLALYHAQRPAGSSTMPPPEKSLVSLFKGTESAMQPPEPKSEKPLPVVVAPPPVPIPAMPPAKAMPQRSYLPLQTPQVPVVQPEEKKDLKPAANLILPQD